MSEIESIILRMKAADKKAIMTRDGQGEYSSATFRRLMALGLVEPSLCFTELGFKVRERLSTPSTSGEGKRG